jgi:hypothetical protein
VTSGTRISSSVTSGTRGVPLAEEGAHEEMRARGIEIVWFLRRVRKTYLLYYPIGSYACIVSASAGIPQVL